MEQEMLIISKQQVSSLIDRMSDQGNIASCIEEVRRMREIKAVLYWRADVGSSCIGRELSVSLDGEVKMLDDTLEAIEAGDVSRSIMLLAEYEQTISA